jgi:murein L,D-transpeptidase YcbB/YkuD
MPGVRFFASTAIILMVSAAAGGALAEPKSGIDLNTAAPTPGMANVAALGGQAAQPAKPTDSANQTPAPAATAKPNQPTDQPAATDVAPAATAKPEQSTNQPAPAAAAKPDELITQPAAADAAPAAAAKPDQSADQPAAAAVAPPVSTPNPSESPEEPVAPAVTEAPPTKPEPPAAAVEGAVPTTSVAAPAATPSEPAATAAPSPVVEADAAIVEQLRELANGKFDRIIGSKKERTSVDAFYAARNYAPLWITDGKANERSQAAIAYLGQVYTDGLDPAGYPVPSFASLTDPAALAEAEIKLASSVITYARHAQMGRVHWSRVSGDIYYDRKPPEPAEVLAKMAEAEDVGEALDAYEPQFPAYVALKAKLAEIRAGKNDGGKTPIANGAALKVGMQDERVPPLRERLGVPGDSDTYDKPLAEAVKKFQLEHELKATGTLTAPTIEALNGRRPDRPTDIILANMERLRWMPHDLGKTYVIVNLPDFTLRVMHDGKQLWMTKIVDGKPAMPTPIMTAEMKYITVNPTWNVPPSIVAHEYLPALQQDPTVLERMGLKVSTNPDGTVHISQPPGDKNALGRLRFNFPNKFLVYQHDTPDKHLFALDKRAFSHGCMRVQDPVKYAEVLLSLVRPHDGYTQDRIRKMFGEGELDISFPTFVPVHLTYQTAFVDEQGKLEFREDIYGRDKALLAILKGDDRERKVADIPVERRENAVRREALAMPDYYSGQNFFSRLFGPFSQPQPAPAPRKRAAQGRTEFR